MCEGLAIILFNGLREVPLPADLNRSSGRDTVSSRSAEGVAAPGAAGALVPREIIASCQPDSIATFPLGLVKSGPVCSGARNNSKFRAMTYPLSTRPTVPLYGE